MLVALTGWGHDEGRRKSSEAGFNGYMVKPMHHAALMKVLAELLPMPVGSLWEWPDGESIMELGSSTQSDGCLEFTRNK